MEDCSSSLPVQPKLSPEVRWPTSFGPIRLVQVEAGGLGFFQLSKDSEASSVQPPSHYSLDGAVKKKKEEEKKKERSGNHTVKIVVFQ